MLRPIAILTDFGLEDVYVGVMKGVIQGILPGVSIIDLSHHVVPQDVRQAAFMLLAAHHYFPPETVFVVVVDPGVGTVRKAIAVRAGDYYFVAPDNGVLSYVLAEIKEFQAHVIENPVYHLPQTSHTFHGRDILAPAAAYLSSGVSIDCLGSKLDNLIQLPMPYLVVKDRLIETEVIHIDHFGNLITGIGILNWVDSNRIVLRPFTGGQISVFDSLVTRVSVNDCTISGICSVYGHVNPGMFVVYVGSSGFLEIAVNQGNAAAVLGIEVGARVSLRIGE